MQDVGTTTNIFFFLARALLCIFKYIFYLRGNQYKYIRTQPLVPGSFPDVGPGFFRQFSFPACHATNLTMTRQKICLLLVLSHHNWRGIHSFAPLLPSKWVAVSRTKVGTGLFATPEEPAAARRSGRKTAKTITKTPEPPSALDTQVEALEESELPNFPFKSSTREPSSKTIPWLQRFQDSVFLGVPPTFEICAIMTIYFVEGALGLTQLAQTYMLKDELGLGPAQASALGGLLILPWTLKPLYGFLSDGFPLFGSKRRSYLVLCGLIGCLADIALGFSGSIGGNVLYSTLGLLITSSACIAFSDVVADGMVVQQTRREGDSQAGALQSLCWGSAAVGGLVSAYFSGWLLETMSPRQVFGLSALLPLMVSTIAFWIKEEEGTTTQEPSMDAVTDQVKALWSALKQPNIWKPALFMFLWQSTPSSSSAFLYFMTNELGFGPEFLGRAKLVTNLSSLVGVWLYQKYLRTVR